MNYDKKCNVDIDLVKEFVNDIDRVVTARMRKLDAGTQEACIALSAYVEMLIETVVRMYEEETGRKIDLEDMGEIIFSAAESIGAKEIVCEVHNKNVKGAC